MMGKDDLLVRFLASFLWQKHTMDVGQDATSSNCDTTKQLAQLLIIADCQLNVAGHNAGLFVVTSSISCQLQNFSRKVLQHCCLHRKAVTSSNCMLQAH